MSSLTEIHQHHRLESYRWMGRSEEHWLIGTSFGVAEARKAITAHGPSLTWDTAHAWLNKVIGAGLQERGISVNFGTWERGCRIMFMLKIRHALN